MPKVYKRPGPFDTGNIVLTPSVEARIRAYYRDERKAGRVPDVAGAIKTLSLPGQLIYEALDKHGSRL